MNIHLHLREYHIQQLPQRCGNRLAIVPIGFRQKPPPHELCDLAVADVESDVS